MVKVSVLPKHGVCEPFSNAAPCSASATKDTQGAITFVLFEPNLICHTLWIFKHFLSIN